MLERYASLPAPPGYFLSSSNPLATEDQKALEQLALRIREMPVVRQARQLAADHWRVAYGHEGASAQALTLFETAMDEYAFNFILKAVNADGHYPKIVQDFMPPHEWFGMQIPGSRMGGDNPDNIYRIIPIEHGSRYTLHGQCLDQRPASITYTLMSNYGTSKTICTLEQDDMEHAEDGSFVITVDDQPAGGRRNHLMTDPTVKLMFVRDSLNDWERETPNALFIRRLDPPTRDPLSEEQIAALAAEIMTDHVPLYYWFTRLCSGRPVNTLPNPMASASLGGLVTQTGLQGNFRIADDEALVITYAPAGATYSGPVLHDWWFRTIDYWEHQTSLTMGHSCPNADGTYTVIVSHHDPGFANWIDTAGLDEHLVVQRWQGLGHGPAGDGPAIDIRLIKFAELEQTLPAGMRRISADQRAQQLARRRAAYQRRLVDG